MRFMLIIMLLNNVLQIIQNVRVDVAVQPSTTGTIALLEGLSSPE